MCRQVAGHTYGTTAVGFSPDGSTLATAGNDGMVRLWWVATGSQRIRLDGQSSRLTQVAYSADGRTLAACGGDNHVRLWDVAEILGTPTDPDED